MEQADILALPRPKWKAEYLEDTSLRRLVLEHYDREHVPLLRYLALLGVDRETSRELVQESFLKLHEHLLNGGDRSNLRAWLYRVAHNLARNTQSAFRSSKTESLTGSEGAREPVSEAVSAEEELLAEERVKCFREAMNQLSLAQRECLTLRAQGFKYREIAEVLNLSVSTVGENVARALERLKDLL
ncbi:MAG: RNA polymerase sigma factor [Acidobacteriaceae bacterium]|nr:RNA polymerase sigma factor [Acidobacteriaceae bacterium]MBV9767024.1 RNA polymerase sigma factor [Acidobacteriaceae bacterium]